VGLLIDTIYSITAVLQGPVILALLALLVWSLYHAGGFVREWQQRRLVREPWRTFLGQVKREATDRGSLRDAFYGSHAHPTLVHRFWAETRGPRRDFVHLKRAISEIELAATRSSNHIRIGIRIGPMLGLIGTLVPMGPALKAIATGNIEMMSTNLIVAFSTTVVGLLIAGTCYVMHTIRQYWYVQDISDIDYLMETLFEDEEERD